MKKTYIAFIFALVAFNVIAQNSFITKWEVSTQDLSITIPTTGDGYDYTVDFGDGTVLTNVTGDATHSYNTSGIYNVSITGYFPRIYFSLSPSFDKIIGIEQWGNIEWQSMEGAFERCSNLILNAVDTPDLSQVTSLKGMFGRTAINTNINNWDVSNVTDMSSMFSSATFFNQPLDNWDVSNVTDMSSMFATATSFNQPLNNWDVSNVTNMSSMFYNNYGPTTFNHPLNDWDVSSVTNMSRMFSQSFFNQSLDNWDVSNVVNMEGMFGGGLLGQFNKPIGNWDVSSVTNMRRMFHKSNYTFPLDTWDVSNVENMSEMFAYSNAFDQPLNNWDVSNVTNMSKMFKNARAFNQPLNNWDVSSVTDMNEMFYYNQIFNRPLNDWDISNVNDMGGMFYKAISFNQDLSSWNFNQSAFLNSMHSFVSFSGLDVYNYDNLLSHLVSFNIYSRTLGAKDLEYCNHTTRDYMINTLGWEINGDVQSQNCNLISGMVTYDEDNNGCDPNDIGISGLMVNATDGNHDITTFSRNGTYELGTIGTSFTVSLINIPDYFIADPASADVTFTTSNTEQADFCVTATQIIEDLSITLLPLTAARPGFVADYQLIVENRGTQIVSNVAISLVFDDGAQIFLNAYPSPVSNTVNELIFEFENLVPFGQQVIDLTMETFTPPIVNGGDILIFTANVTPNVNDYTPEDNTFVYEQTVVNSFDPNDKQVLQGEEIYLDQADQYLDYLIRFQNTGTASAINVRILDTLHPKLDWTTIRPLNASHDYHIEITNGNNVEFIFNDIDLPHEAGNESESHGFAAYKIKPISGVQVGDVITGDASIFFDFNAPIITNTVSTEIVDRVMSTEDNTALSNHVVLYPNPADGKLNLRTTNGIQLQKTTIYSIQGQKMKDFSLVDNSINIENLSSGMYLLKIETNLGIINRNFIKN